MTQLLGRPPKRIADFIGAADSGRLASAALRQWRPWLLAAGAALAAVLVGWWVVVGKPG